MRHFLPALILLLAALPCHAQDEMPKPNTLTPKEIADGWILLFDGESTFGLKTEGEFRIENGILVIGGGKKVSNIKTFELSDYEIQFESNHDMKGGFHAGWEARMHKNLRNLSSPDGWTFH